MRRDARLQGGLKITARLRKKKKMKGGGGEGDVYVSADLLENKITRACHLIHAQMLAAAALGERISSEVSSCGRRASTRKRRYLAKNFFLPSFEVKFCSYLVFTA